MASLFHLLFTLIKISILSSIYAALLLAAFRITGNKKPESWFYRVSRNKFRLWFRSGLIISVSLFIFMFTYYGNHGFGDSARVPVGHGRSIQQVDGVQAYIQEDGVSMLPIDKFIVTDDFVYGMAGDFNENYDGNFFFYDLASNIVTSFTREKDYLEFLKKKGVNDTADYKDFYHYYSEYWGGWRFWTLP